MARPRSSSSRHLLPCRFIFLFVVLIAAVLTDSVIANSTNIFCLSRAVLPVSAGGAFELFVLQEGGSAPTINVMIDAVFSAKSSSSCDTTRCKKTRMSSRTTMPTPSVSSTSDHGTSSSPSPILRCFGISTSSSRRRHSSHFLCTWALPLYHFDYRVSGFFNGRCSWVPPVPLSTCRVRPWLSTGGRWQVAIKGQWCYVFYMQTFCIQRSANLKVGKGTSNTYFLLCTCSRSKHGSDKTSFNVRADLRLQSMLVLRFNVESSRVKSLSLVKAIRYLRLKITNPHRCRPIRQVRGAPAVLSKCNKEDPKCLWRGYHSAQRPRWRLPVLVSSKV
ncbi:unnamed protein product [Urochloa humidicola]